MTTGTQPEPNLGIKKAGSAILINIDKTNQKMTVFLDGSRKIRLASLNRQSRIFNSIWNLYRYLHERNLVQQTMG